MAQRKILMALMGLEIGGAETHVVELSKELRRMGYDIAVVSNGGVYVAELEEAGIRHYEAPMHRRNVRLMLKSLLRLRRIIAREKPDVVHAHARIPAFLCGLLKPVMGFPFVTSAHWVFEVNAPLRLLTNWGQRTVAVSEDIKTYLRESYGVPGEHVTVTINSIDTEKFSPSVSGRRVLKELGLDPDKPVVSYVSRMDESRALVARQLVEIAPRLRRAVPDLQFLIAGGGDVYDEILAKAEAVNAAEGCRCIAMPGARTDINEIAAAGDVFVGVSRSALEAMAAAKPVIVAGNEGYIGLFTKDKLELARESNFCCRGCPMSTCELLEADLLHALALSREEKDALGAYGREVIGEYYSVRRMASDCVSVYKQVWRRKSVVLSGYYGFRNLGDDAILDAIARQVRSMSDPPRLTVLSNAPQETKNEYGVDAVYRFSPLAVYRAIRKCDYFISGGGSLLQDETSAKSLLYYVSLIRAAQLHRKPVMIFANGIGPIRRTSGQRMVRNCLNKAGSITLREDSSYQALRDIGVTNPNIRVTADPVFLIDGIPEAEARALLAKSGAAEGARRLIGVSLRPARGLEEHLDALARFCDGIAAQPGAGLVFLDMQDPWDGQISRRVEEKMSARACRFASRSAPEMMGVIRCMDAVVSMRLHTLIFSAKQRVPLLGIVYDPKVSAYLQMLDMPSAGAIESFDPDYALGQLTALLADLPARREHLERAVPRLEEAAQENWSIFTQMLGGADK